MALVLRTYCREARLDAGRPIRKLLQEFRGKFWYIGLKYIVTVTRTNQILDVF